MFYKMLTTVSHAQKAAILMTADLCVVVVALIVAQILSGESAQLVNVVWYLPVLIPVAAGTIKFLGLNRIKLNAYGMDDVAHTFLVSAVLAITGIAMNVLIGSQRIQLVTMIEFATLFLLFSIAVRITLRKLVQSIVATKKTRKKVLIYGAGQTGQQLAAALQTDDEFEAACFVDDDPNLKRLTILGLRVHAANTIPMLVRRIGIERIVLAMPSADQAVRLRLGKRLSGLGCEVLALPSFADMVLRGEEAAGTAPLELNRLLGRDAVEAELPQTETSYKDQRIMVTGAGGSIGGELCRQIVRCKPRELVLVDHSEYALYRVARALRDCSSGVKLTAILGSVEHPELMREIMNTHQIDVVFHAAAYKHVNLVQTNPFEGVRNNVIGTRVVAEEARRAGVSRFILVSTDKAVRPTSMMGSSKRLAELVIQDLATRSQHTKFSMVRFGNVLGSSGSVVPLFQKQIRDMGPVTVTHPDVTRYFMTVDEAVRLVLLAGTFSRGGDVFVLDMGQPVSIYSVAQKMIDAAGYSQRDESNPNGDIAITFTGLKEGEKMHEELLIGSDMLTTMHPKIMRAQENLLSELEIAAALLDLRRAIEIRDIELLEATLLKCVEPDTHTKIAAKSVAAPQPILTVVGD